MSFENIIKKNRPKIAMSSLVSYLSNLKYVNKHFKHLHNIDLDSVDKYIKYYKEILHMLDEELTTLKPSVRKTKIASIIVLLDSEDNNLMTEKVLKEYRMHMLVDEYETRKFNNSQQLTKKIQDNLISQDEVMNIYNDLKERVEPLWKVKSLNRGELRMIQKYVLLSLYTLIPPRRALDYSDFRIRDFKPSEKSFNYMIKSTKTSPAKFVFNVYKNAGRIGSQEIEIPQELEDIINKWMKINKSPWLLVSTTGDKIRGNQLALILNDIFDKKISVSLLRHIYLTDKYKDVDLEELQKDASDMGSSDIQRTLQYVKKE
jgi:hypothetical protein